MAHHCRLACMAAFGLSSQILSHKVVMEAWVVGCLSVLKILRGRAECSVLRLAHGKKLCL